MPNILEMQTAIAQVAAACGGPPKRTSTRLPLDHPANVELGMPLSERSLDYDGLTRFILNRRVSRCRNKARKLTATARA